MNTIEKVAEFHAAMGQPSAETPELPDTCRHDSIDMGVEALADALALFKVGAEMGCRRCLRLRLITEELRELAEAMRDEDMEGTLDALVDIRYVVDGTVVEFGLDAQAPQRREAGHVWTVFDEAFRRVHAANMAKLGPDGKPVIDATGKIKKPTGWTAPDLSDLVKP